MLITSFLISSLSLKFTIIIQLSVVSCFSPVVMAFNFGYWPDWSTKSQCYWLSVSWAAVMLLTVKTQNVYLCILIPLFSIYYENQKGSVEIFAVLGTFTFSVILDRNNVWFQKLSIPPPWKGFFLRPPHPSGNSSQASYTHLNFWAFDNPPPPRKFQSLLWGNMDIFWNYTMRFFTFYCLFYCLLT